MSYYYSWRDGFSTDSEWDDRRKQNVVVRCNGIEQSKIFQCLTGENGFVEKIMVDSDGNIVCAKGHIITEFYIGNVTIEWKD